MLVLGRPTHVGWRMAKDAENRRNHRMSLGDGKPVLDSPATQSVLQHVEGEEREVLLGPGADGRLLVVVTEWVNTGEQLPRLRIISVREATSHEREHGLTEDEQSREPPRPIDPDNPPLTGHEKWGPWRDRFLKKYDEMAARIAARRAAKKE